jgi:hydrogenase-4 component B
VLGIANRLILVGADGEPVRVVAGLGYTSDVMEIVERLIHRPLARPLAAAVQVAKRLQSGRLDAYIAYMLIALVTALALVLVVT